MPFGKKLYGIVVLALVIAVAANAGQPTPKGTIAQRAAVQLAGMGFRSPQPPTRALPGAACRGSFSACLGACGGVDQEGCWMDCETDCSVCVLETSGAVGTEICDR